MKKAGIPVALCALLLPVWPASASAARGGPPEFALAGRIPAEAQPPASDPGEGTEALDEITEITALNRETVLRLRKKLAPTSTVRVMGRYGSVVLFGPEPHSDGLEFRDILSAAPPSFPSLVAWHDIESIDVLGRDSSGIPPAVIGGSILGALVVVPFTGECNRGELFGDIGCGADAGDVAIGALVGGVIGLALSVGKGDLVWKPVR